jgi:hypothetical protein
MPPWLQSALSTLGTLGLAALALKEIFKRTVGGWIDQAFEEKSKTLQHGLDKKLEEYKASLSATSRKLEKANDVEFEVLQQIVPLLNSAVGAIAVFIGATWKSVLQPSRMRLSDFVQWLDESTFTPSEKTRVLKAPADDMDAVYEEIQFIHERDAAQSKWAAFHNYLLDKKYVLGNLQRPLAELDIFLNRFMSLAQRQRRDNKAYIDYKEWETIHEKLEAVSRLVSARLSLPHE